MSNNKKTIFVAMSGGVDSSVAAALLKKQGFDVVGAHIKCFNIDGCGERDAEDARRVAEQLKIPFYVFDLEKEYKDRVIEYMIDGYKKGITPNPDVMCNKEIKFGLFLKRALELGADYVATGHYVRIKNYELRIKRNDKKPLFIIHYSLFTARDANKDQSYFLWTLTQNQLKHCLFPIGEYKKTEVRRLAKKFGLLTAEKKDSQGICFLGRVRLDDFLSQYIKPKIGPVRLALGGDSYKIIGDHKGVYFYTIGQRHGLGIGGSAEPKYVVEKNIKNNTLTVAEGESNPALYKKEITLTNVNFISKKHSHILENVRMSILVRVRYRQPLFLATLTGADFRRTSTGTEHKITRKSPRDPRFVREIRVIFTKPQKFIAPGQSAVFYDKFGQMLGGGVIM